MDILSKYEDIMSFNAYELADSGLVWSVDECLSDRLGCLNEAIMAADTMSKEEESAKRLLDENTAQINMYRELAEKSRITGGGEDAGIFLGKAELLAVTGSRLETAYRVYRENTAKLSELKLKLESDIDILEGLMAALRESGESSEISVCAPG